MLLLIGFPALTLSTRFLANSKNISSFSLETFVSWITVNTNGADPIIIPIPITKKKALV